MPPMSAKLWIIAANAWPRPKRAKKQEPWSVLSPWEMSACGKAGGSNLPSLVHMGAEIQQEHPSPLTLESLDKPQNKSQG